jgi:hypothetical protein
VLFSNDQVANFINRYFEPAWEMVRPVPTIRIDFGNNTVVTRTLHGNIATYVCTAEGDVLDILPGIYTPDAYVHSLNQFRLLAAYIRAGYQAGGRRCDRLESYHEECARALAKNQRPPVLVNTAGITKAAIERTVVVLVSGQGEGRVPFPERQVLAQAAPQGKAPKLDSPEELANWKLLAEDTKQNEALRRRQIHEMLAGAGQVKPEQVKKQLYKEVLHADLDDPYLGLGGVLFSNYPFAREDQRP